MKKLNSIEKIIIIVLVVGIILGVGIFVLIKPVFDKIAPADRRIDSLTTELSELNEKLKRLDTIDADIESERKSVLDLEKEFYPELTTYEANELVRVFLEDNNLDTLSISVSNLSTTSLSLDSFSRSTISYNLKNYSRTAAGPDENALEGGQFRDGNKVYTINVNSLSDITITDEDGNEVKKSNYTTTMRNAYISAVESFADSENLSQTVAATNVSFAVTGTYSDYLKFLDYINDLDRAAYISSVVIPVTTANTQLLAVTDGETVTNEEVPTGTFSALRDNSQVQNMSINLVLLSVEPMSRPDSISVGDKTVDIKNTY